MRRRDFLKKGTANCDLHLPEGKPVEIHLKPGRHNPLDGALLT